MLLSQRNIIQNGHIDNVVQCNFYQNCHKYVKPFTKLTNTNHESRVISIPPICPVKTGKLETTQLAVLTVDNLVEGLKYFWKLV